MCQTVPNNEFRVYRRPRILTLLASPWTWCGVGLLLRLLYMLDQAGTSPLFYVPLLDEKEALDSARALLQGSIERDPFFKAPGFSYILAGVLAISGDAWSWVLRIVQHTAGAAIIWMAAVTAGRLVPKRNGLRARAAAVGMAGFFAAFYAPMIRLEENVSLDFWVVFFQSAMLFWLMKLPWVLARQHSQSGSGIPPLKTPSTRNRRVLLYAGLFAAAAWLTRPTLTAVLPLLVLWIAFAWWKAQRQRSSRAAGRSRKDLRSCRGLLRATAFFLAPALAAMLATATRNYLVSGETLVLPWQGGYSFYEANKPGANGRYLLQSDEVQSASANPTHAIAVNGYRASLTPAARAQFDAVPSFGAVNHYWMQRARSAIQTDPAAWLGLMTRKAVYLFSDKEIYNYEDFDLQRSRSILLRAMPITFGVVFPLALASLALMGVIGSLRRQAVLLFWIYTAGLGGAIALYFVSGRMRMPLAFPMIVLAGQFCGVLAGEWTLLRPKFSRQQGSMRTGFDGRIFAAALLLAAGVVISFGDWWGVRSESMAYADLARMSNAAWQRGRYEQALDFALQAEKLAPDYPTLPRLKGQALYYLGRLQEARAEFEKSVRVLGDETSRNNINVIDQEMAKRH